MKKIFSLLMLATMTRATAQNADTYFLSQPSLTPDGQSVIFCFEGDIWKAGLSDRQGFRLTAMQGNETNPKVSPDGKWIAFTGRQFGGADIFVMPSTGGDIKQLTWHSAPDEITSWSWDSKTIYFNSTRMGQISGYKVGIGGGTPVRVFGEYYFQFDHNLVEHPSGEIFFNDTWESNNQVQRKRYRGPFNPDIQSYNPSTKQYKRYTDWIGKDFNTTIDRKGNIYFISDEANGEYNLYTFEKGKKSALTTFPTSIKSPSVNANGGKVVFEKDYQLWLYDVASGKTDKLAFSLFRNNILTKEKDFEVRGVVSYFDVSPDGKKLAFISRGEIFVSDVDGKFVEQVSRGSAERATEVKWLADNRTLLFNQTKNGYLNWYTIAANASLPKAITAENRNNRNIVFNKKRTKAVYLSGRDMVKMLDLKTWQVSTVAKDEIWGFQNANPGFSPNDDYVLFTAYRDFEQDIFIHDLKKNTTINLTNTGITETDPLWSQDGKYIYFTSSRLKPAYPLGLQNPHVYRLALEKLDDPYRIDKFNEMFKEEKKDTARKDTSAKLSPQVPTPSPLVIDMDNIMERIELISPPSGDQGLEALLQKGDKTTVLYYSNHGEGRYALWKTVLEPFETIKTEKIAGTDNLGSFQVVESGDKYFMRFNGTLQKLNLDQNRVDPINISYAFRRNLQEEFTQIFEEMWADVEENYYDENFHGIDWQKMKEKYQRYVPYLNTRADLRTLMNDLLGELNSSHQGFNTTGEDENVSLQNRTMETGIIFRNNAPYTVDRVLKRSPADHKGVDIRSGDVLVKVNDRAVDASMDRNFYFTKPSLDKELDLTFTRNGQTIDVKLHPEPTSGGTGNTLNANLYDEWTDDNQKRVDAKSNNRIAYTHMKDMGQEELDNFLVDMSQELNHKDGLIFDLRYNTGGNVHDEVLRFLAQRSYLQWKYREGKLTKQSSFAPSDKPIVLLINEQSLSDAEMTSEGFKALKLGKIIGNETYHWIIFTSGMRLVDGSTVRMPAWGCYSLEGKDIEKNGVKPDILVINTFTDKIGGDDRQLDRAIEEIMKQLK